MFNDETYKHNSSVNRIKNKWKRPWNLEKFDDLYNRDERFFSILIKGVIAYLNENIKMYDKGINHFIFNTGSSYMYVVTNGYEFSWNETSGEDQMYMQMPRCVIELGSISIPQEELSQQFARANYERRDGDTIKGYNAEVRRLPIELSLSLHYVFSTFNESIVVLQELIDKLVFQQYFNITYLGQVIRCSLEFPNSAQIQFNKIDMASTDVRQKNIDIELTVCTNYPIINEHTEISTANIIAKFMGFVEASERSKDVVIVIDGIEAKQNDKFLDMRPFDFNRDGKIDETEIDTLREFIGRFDADEDSEVTSHDMSIITEKFSNSIYDINYDILNKGKFDIANLLAIKEIFNIIDINHDEIVNSYEIEELISVITTFSRFDTNNDLIIDYNDLNTILAYIEENNGMSWIGLQQELASILKESVMPISVDLNDYILGIFNENVSDMKVATEYWLSTHDISIDNSTLLSIYSIASKAEKLLAYDINEDRKLDRTDADLIVSMLSEFTGKVIKYFAASSIMIHMNDHMLKEDSITDTVNFKEF